MRIYNVDQRRKKPSPGRYRVRPLPQAGEVRVTAVGPFYRLSRYVGKIQRLKDFLLCVVRCVESRRYVGSTRY